LATAKRLSLFQQSYSTLGARRSRRVHGAESRGDSKAHIAMQGGDQIVASTTNASVDHFGLKEGTSAMALIKATGCAHLSFCLGKIKDE